MFAPTMPDVEAIVYQRIQDLGGIQSFAYDAGSVWPYVTDTVAVQIDVYASSKKAARDRAYEARQRLLTLPFEDTRVSLVDVVTGPSWLQAEDGTPRYVIRISVTVRGDRG